MYTVTTISGFLGKVEATTLADAAMLKRAWETNQPWAKGEVVVFDQYAYLVPESELSKGRAMKRRELLDELQYVS